MQNYLAIDYYSQYYFYKAIVLLAIPQNVGKLDIWSPHYTQNLTRTLALCPVVTFDAVYWSVFCSNVKAGVYIIDDCRFTSAVRLGIRISVPAEHQYYSLSGVVLLI